MIILTLTLSQGASTTFATGFEIANAFFSGPLLPLIYAFLAGWLIFFLIKKLTS